MGQKFSKKWVNFYQKEQLLIKSDHRLSRNYLKGFIGDKINLLLVLTAFNLKKWINNYLRLLFLYRFLLLGVILYKIEDKED